MEKEYILQKYTMPEVLRQYGITPNRSGFINCPSHTDKNASCKVYEKNIHCFSCGYSANILDLCGHIHNETNLNAIIKHFCHDFGETYQRKEGHVKTSQRELDRQREIRFAKWKCRTEQQRISEYRKQIYNSNPLKQDEWVRACRQNRWITDWLVNNWSIRREIEEYEQAIR